MTIAIDTLKYTSAMAEWIKDLHYVYVVYGVKDTTLYFGDLEDMTAFKLAFKV